MELNKNIDPKPRGSDKISNAFAELQHGLPFGNVMATGGASLAAGISGLTFLVRPLLLIAMGQIIAKALMILAKYDFDFFELWERIKIVRVPSVQVGFHTIPLGLAVVTVGLVDWSTSWKLAEWLGLFFLLFTWVSELLLMTQFFKGLNRLTVSLKEVDGAWFLVPAGMLGTAIATLAVSDIFPSGITKFVYDVAMLTAFLGWGAFLLLLGCVVQRISKYGLKGSSPIYWWISMGCAGLSSAALGHFVSPQLVNGLWMNALFDGFVLAGGLIAILLCVPVYFLGLRFLLTKCEFRDRAAWPPTFSSAVFCLGTVEAGHLLNSMVLYHAGNVLAILTVILWFSTVLWNTILKRVNDQV